MELKVKELSIGEVVSIGDKLFTIMARSGSAPCLTPFCSHSETTTRAELNCYPFGDNMMVETCNSCGKIVKCRSME